MLVYYHTLSGSANDGDVERLLRWMPNQQKAIVEGMKSVARRWEQVLAYAMLTHALHNDRVCVEDEECFINSFVLERLHVSNNAELPLWSFGRYGKPRLSNFTGLEFNISHCKQAVVVAVAGRVVGVDAEGRRRVGNTVIGKACNSDEQNLINKSTDAEAEFARIWTRKEAFFKWTGTGIIMSRLPDVEHLAAAAGCIITTHWIENNGFFISVAR